MSYLNKKSEPFKLEDQIPLGALNNLRDGMPRQVRGGAGISVEQMGDRLVVRDNRSPVVTPDHGNYAAQFVVRQEFDDYLLCVPFTQPAAGSGWWEPQEYDSTLESGAVIYTYIAKPYILQKTPWHNKTVTANGEDFDIAYTATVGERELTDTSGNVYTQKINPYLSGEVIWARKGLTGLTAPNGLPIVWADENSAGRQWITDEVTASDPDTVPPGVYTGPVSTGTLVQLVNQIAGQQDKYETWWRSSYTTSYYPAGGDKMSVPAVGYLFQTGTIYCLPFLIARTGTIDSIGVYPANPASSGAKVRIGLYIGNVTSLGGLPNYPGALLFDSGEVDVDTYLTDNIEAVACDVDVEAYSIVWAVVATNATQPNLYARELTDLWPFWGYEKVRQPLVGLAVSAAFAALLVNFSGYVTVDGINGVTHDYGPVIGIRMSFPP